MPKYFAIQLSESTVISDCAILLCFVHYRGKEDLKEEVQGYINLSGRTTGQRSLDFKTLLRKPLANYA